MEEEKKRDPKKFLGIYFECCNAYGRLYQNAQGTHYVGRCPKCMMNLKIPIGSASENPKATNQRFFRAR